MKTNNLKTLIKVASVVVCLFSINDGNAQRQAQRHAKCVPYKLLKLESIAEETTVTPGSTGSNNKVNPSIKENTLETNLKWLSTKNNKTSSISNNFNFTKGGIKPRTPLPYKTWNKYY